MGLSNTLLKKFADTVTDDGSDKETKTTAYGTVVVSGEKKYVQLDGSDTLTAISEATDVESGDRIIAMIENHTATVFGNITCPASARTASSYMKLTEDGLLVGELDSSGNTKGTASLIGPGVYNIVDSKGNVLASFSLDGSAFCEGKCKINADDGTMVLYADDAVGLRSKYLSGSNDYRAEVVCTAQDSNPVVSIQAYQKDNSSATTYINVTKNGATLNGSELVTTKNLICDGTVSGSGTIKAGKAVRVSATVSPPSGYVLAGIRQVSTNGTFKNIVLMRFITNPSTNEVAVRLRNISDTTDYTVTVSIEWFGLYSAGSISSSSGVVTFGDEDD